MVCIYFGLILGWLWLSGFAGFVWLICLFCVCLVMTCRFVVVLWVDVGFCLCILLGLTCFLNRLCLLFTCLTLVRILGVFVLRELVWGDFRFVVLWGFVVGLLLVDLIRFVFICFDVC